MSTSRTLLLACLLALSWTATADANRPLRTLQTRPAARKAKAKAKAKVAWSRPSRMANRLHGDAMLKAVFGRARMSASKMVREDARMSKSPMFVGKRDGRTSLLAFEMMSPDGRGSKSLGEAIIVREVSSKGPNNLKVPVHNGYELVARAKVFSADAGNQWTSRSHAIVRIAPGEKLEAGSAKVVHVGRGDGGVQQVLLQATGKNTQKIHVVRANGSRVSLELL